MNSPFNIPVAHKTISPQIVNFMSIRKADPIASGEDLMVWKLHLLDIYKAKYGQDFRFYHCYEFAQNLPQVLFATEGNSSKKLSLSDDSSQKSREGVGSLENCPVGTKKAIQIKKEGEMVE